MKTKKRKKRLDAVAAQVLLEAFLEAERYGDRTPGESLQSAGDGEPPDTAALDDSR